MVRMILLEPQESGTEMKLELLEIIKILVLLEMPKDLE
jgi:hypothetical protein